MYYKYQGAGNDFVMIDNRQGQFDKNDTNLVASLCDRHFGIGADGLILIEPHRDYDFQMVYFNADGKQSSMCGNGGRCAVSFAFHLGIIQNKTEFLAIDGLHEALVYDNGEIIDLKMIDVELIKQFEDHFFLDTGSPHHVEFHKDISKIDVQQTGSSIRYGAPYFDSGSNVNFVQASGPNRIKLRTYERGVEGETLACGTGATAAAIAYHLSKQTDQCEINVEVLGGELSVRFIKNDEQFNDVWLKGPAKPVFKAKLL
ncbi:MAG: diaminopimelate epimerase [Flavobacteriaceae bacterium]